MIHMIVSMENMNKIMEKSSEMESVTKGILRELLDQSK